MKPSTVEPAKKKPKIETTIPQIHQQEHFEEAPVSLQTSENPEESSNQKPKPAILRRTSPSQSLISKPMMKTNVGQDMTLQQSDIMSYESISHMNLSVSQDEFQIEEINESPQASSGQDQSIDDTPDQATEEISQTVKAEPESVSLDRPKLSYAQLISEALHNSTDGQLRLSEIYQFISQKHPYYKLQDGGWRNSIRHNLSVNKDKLFHIIKTDRFFESGLGDEVNLGRGGLWKLLPAGKALFEKGRKRKMHKCKICPVQATNYYMLSEHVRNHHMDPTNETFKCSLCNNGFNSLEDLQSHIKTHDEVSEDYKLPRLPEIKCKRCPKEFSSVELLESHVKSEHFQQDSPPSPKASDNHMCNVCGMTFDQNQDLAVHFENVHQPPVANPTPKLPKKMYMCTYCDNVFDSPVHINKHELEAHGHKCDTCGKIFMASGLLAAHVESYHKVPSPKKKYMCTYCDDVFDSLEALNKHEPEAHGQKCGSCDKVFMDSGHLAAHVQSDHKAPPKKKFLCSYCDNVYHSLNEMAAHMNQAHRQKCGVCGKSFGSREDLQNHKMKDHVIANLKVQNSESNQEKSAKPEVKVASSSTDPEKVSEEVDTKRPSLTFNQLIVEAILMSSNSELTYSEICLAISKRYPYYDMKKNSSLDFWQDSVRQILSVSKSVSKSTIPNSKGKLLIILKRTVYI